ncbi:MAG: hypothetical protein M3139_01530 [Bacteroidota bacterium]|nr:hypothetical protein [Bacteroidota bacterium]
MKTIICVSLAPFLFATSIFAAPSGEVTEKVLKIFHQAFPEVKQPTWHYAETYYEVAFDDADNISCRIDYSHDGVMLSTMRYYSEKDLSPAIRAKVSENYPGKSIFGITEVSNNEKITYHIVLEDEKNWYNVESSSTGSLTLEEIWQS